MDSEWMDWNGGACPVDGDTLVDVKFKDGRMEHSGRAAVWSGDRDRQCDALTDDWWRHEGEDKYHIIAYRLSTLSVDPK